jgi:thiol-disulfide isomerase/thioredoxin
LNKKIVLLLAGIIVPSFFMNYALAQELAPDFTLTDIDGSQFSLNNFRGRVVLLDFFATWCSPCLSEIPHLKSLNDEFGNDLVIISISVSPSTDSVEMLQQFRQDYKMNWIITRDTAGVSYDYGIQYIPTLVVIDQEGYIKHQHVGLTDESVLHEEIVSIIPEFETWSSIIIVSLLSALSIVYLKHRKRQKSQTQRTLRQNSLH